MSLPHTPQSLFDGCLASILEQIVTIYQSYQAEKNRRFADKYTSAHFLLQQQELSHWSTFSKDDLVEGLSSLEEREEAIREEQRNLFLDKIIQRIAREEKPFQKIARDEIRKCGLQFAKLVENEPDLIELNKFYEIRNALMGVLRSLRSTC